MSPHIELRNLPIDDLVPAPYNPRKVLATNHPAYRKLRASIRAFGLVEPLIWNERTRHVVGGHTRLHILRELGHTEVPVSVVRLTDAQEKALNVVLNNHEAQGRYDAIKLTGLLDELLDLPEGRLTGFTPGDLADLKFEPLDTLPQIEEAGRIEVTLVTDADTFERIENELDHFIQRHDLISHVRRS